MIRPIKMRRVRRVLRLMVIFYAATLTLVLGCNLFWPRETTPDPAAQVICLGGGSETGVLTSDSLARAERCGQLVRDGLAETVVVTGHGAGALMVDHIVEMGVPRERIALDPHSRSTLQNALFSARLTETETSAILVTDAYHLPRSWVSFRLMGFEDVSLISSRAVVDRPGPLLREVSAIWFNALRVVLYGATFWLDQDVREALLA